MESAIAVAFLCSFLSVPIQAPETTDEGVERAVSESRSVSRTILVGRVLREGRPARGAVVATSAGGQALSAADGSFEIAVDVPLEAECVEVTAVADQGASRGSLFASARVVPPSLSPVTSVGQLVLAPLATCQPRWFPTFGGRRVNDDVRALLVFDDGGGPALYAGGDFTSAGGVEAYKVARWDGVRWAALGSGIAPSASASVAALAVFDDGSGPALYAGGAFTSAGGAAAHNIARWDGSSWSALGSGLDGEVRALAVFDDGSGPALYAGGTFLSAGGQGVGRIARWDGSSWTALGSGLNAAVSALVVFDEGSGSALFAGGSFTIAGGQGASRIARWDGSSWSSLGTGLNGAVSALEVFDAGFGPALHAGGAFTTAGGGPANRVARWEGSTWAALGGGVSYEVFDLAVLDDGGGAALVAAGSLVSGAPANPIARWDGSSWTTLGSGFGMVLPLDAVRAIAAFDAGAGPMLFAGGRFMTTGDTLPRYLVRLDGSTWEAPEEGVGNDVHALAVFDDGSGPALVAGGTFASAGAHTARRVARWDGSGWSPLGNGLMGTNGGNVYALATFDDGSGPALYAGGSFQSYPNRVARWDGAAWQDLASGLNGDVRALAVFDDGSGPALYAGGTFTLAGGVAANRIARWDGASWSALGSGVSGALAPAVNALLVFDDGSGEALYAGGKFTSAGGAAARRIARWDGSSWSAPGTLFGGPVEALAVFDDGSGPALYAGGDITNGSGAALNRVGRWDGTSWSAVGGGMNDTVRSLAVFDDGSGAGLYAGGEFTTAGGVAALSVARWDGSTWSPLGSGLGDVLSSTPVVRALTVFDVRGGPALCVGGSFPTSAARDSFVASWGCPRGVRSGSR